MPSCDCHWPMGSELDPRFLLASMLLGLICNEGKFEMFLIVKNSKVYDNAQMLKSDMSN